MGDINNGAISNVIQENIDIKDNIADAYSAIFEKDATIKIPEGALDDNNLPQTIRNIKTFQIEQNDELNGYGNKIFAERGVLGENGKSNDLNTIIDNNGIYFLNPQKPYFNLPSGAIEGKSPTSYELQTGSKNPKQLCILEVIKIYNSNDPQQAVVRQRLFVGDHVFQRLSIDLNNSSWDSWVLEKEPFVSQDLLLSDDHDLNNVTQEGHYFLLDTISYENSPFLENEAGLLEVFQTLHSYREGYGYLRCILTQRIITKESIYIRNSPMYQASKGPSNDIFSNRNWEKINLKIDDTLKQSNQPADSKTVGDALDTKEDSSNKVTSLESPSDETYPTTKVVSDALDNLNNYINSNIQEKGINNSSYALGKRFVIQNYGKINEISSFNYFSILIPYEETVPFKIQFNNSNYQWKCYSYKVNPNESFKIDNVFNEESERNKLSVTEAIQPSFKLCSENSLDIITNSKNSDYYCISFKRDDNSSFNDEEIENIIQSLKINFIQINIKDAFNGFIDETLSYNGKVADAKTVGDTLDTKENISNKATSLDSPSDETYPTTKVVSDTLDTKVDKEDGKGLSTNDFTNEDKEEIEYLNLIKDDIFQKNNIIFDDENNFKKGWVISSTTTNHSLVRLTSENSNKYVSIILPYNKKDIIRIKFNNENKDDYQWICDSYSKNSYSTGSDPNRSNHSNAKGKWVNIEGNDSFIIKKESEDDKYYCISFRRINEEILGEIKDDYSIIKSSLEVYTVINDLASTGNTSDRSADIQNVLNLTGYCDLGPGDFYIESGIELPENAAINGQGKSTRIIWNGNSTTNLTENSYIFKLNTQCSLSNMQILGNTNAGREENFLKYKIEEDETQSDPTLSESPIGNLSGVLIQGAYTKSGDKNGPSFCTLLNLFIKNIPGCGIKIINTGPKVYAHTQIMNCNIQYCDCGIYSGTYSEFHMYSNTACNYNYYGVICKGGNNRFSNCDLSGNCVGVYLNGYNEPNNGHGMFVGCEFAHCFGPTGDSANKKCGKAIICNGINYGEIFDSCQIGYGQIDIINSKNIKFYNCAIGRYSYITLNNANYFLLNNCAIGDEMKISEAEGSVNNNINIINCLTDGKPVAITRHKQNPNKKNDEEIDFWDNKLPFSGTFNNTIVEWRSDEINNEYKAYLSSDDTALTWFELYKCFHYGLNIINRIVETNNEKYSVQGKFKFKFNSNGKLLSCSYFDDELTSEKEIAIENDSSIAYLEL